MRIALIGGLDRNADQLALIAAQAAHRLEVHSGHVGGTGADELRAIIARAELVIIVTEVNSHGAVLLAKKLCQKAGRGTLVLRRCGPGRLKTVLEAIDKREERLRAAS